MSSLCPPLDIGKPSTESFLLKGFADGFVVKYNTTTQVIITAGLYEVDGELFNLDANTTHNLTSLTALGGVSFNYIYLDKSASTPNAPVFYDEATASVASLVKNGQYHPTNTEDRLVGVIEKTAGFATIRYFDTEIMSPKLIRQITARHTMVVNRVPNGIWQTPPNESSTFTPVNAIEAAIHVISSDVAANCQASWRMSEGTVLETSIVNATSFMQGFDICTTNFWGPLGPSRNIKFGASANDDNTLSAFLMAHGYTR